MPVQGMKNVGRRMLCAKVQCAFVVMLIMMIMEVPILEETVQAVRFIQSSLVFVNFFKIHSNSEYYSRTCSYSTFI